MFVEVELTGKKIDEAYLLPRSAIRPGNVVYLASGNRLVIRPVEILRRLDDTVYVGQGLNTGDLVITTPVSTPKKGMALRLHTPDPAEGP
jgi:multidrug efflux pump subunit AcrA (membrane-fusion protein)